MITDLEKRIVRAVDGAIQAEIPSHLLDDLLETEAFPWETNCPRPHQRALEELARGEADHALVETFAYRFTWTKTWSFVYGPPIGRWVDTSELIQWPSGINREPSFGHHEWPGLSPELLRNAAGEIERLVEDRLLEIDPQIFSDHDWTLYRMPDWLWLAVQEVIRRVPQRRIELAAAADARPSL